MATKLSVFNGALRLMGEERMVDVDENNKKGRELRSAWDDVVKGVFESYPWNCASERVALERLTETPAHTYDYYYAKPSDWLRTINITRTANDDDKLRDYADEAGGIATSETAVYLRYVSSEYLTAVGDWPQILADYVASVLAYETCQAITGNNSKMTAIDGEKRKRKHEATNWDTLQNPPKRIQPGRMVRARRNTFSRFDGSGSR